MAQIWYNNLQSETTGYTKGYTTTGVELLCVTFFSEKILVAFHTEQGLEVYTYVRVPVWNDLLRAFSSEVVMRR